MHSKVFQDANVDTVITTFSKSKSSTTVELYKCVESEFVHLGQIDQNDWVNSEDYSINIFLTEEIDKVLKKIENSGKLFGELAEIVRGVGVYHKRVGHTKEFIKSDPYQSETKKDETFVPYLRGRNLSPWLLNWQNNSFISYGNWLAEPREIKYFEGPRVLVRKILSKGIIATYIEDKFIVDQQIYTAKLNNSDLGIEQAIASIICSTLMSFYFRFKYSEFDDLFPQIKLAHVKNLPIPDIDKNDELIDLSNKLLEQNKTLLKP